MNTKSLIANLLILAVIIVVSVLGKLALDAKHASRGAEAADTVQSADTVQAALQPGRPRSAIQGVVMKNMGALRYAYNRLQRDKPGSAGKVTVKFAIDEHGKIIFIQTVESTMNDPEFEDIVVDIVKKWDFGPIHKPGDVTEVTYPFVFTE